MEVQLRMRGEDPAGSTKGRSRLNATWRVRGSAEKSEEKAQVAQQTADLAATQRVSLRRS
jgi:hypothetical protein